MIKDISGVFLTPGNYGNDCLGNGEHYDKNGYQIICCDECNYQLCCSEEPNCQKCTVTECPRKHRCTD